MAADDAFSLPSGFEASGIQRQIDATVRHPFQMNRQRLQHRGMAKLHPLLILPSFPSAEQQNAEAIS